MTCAPDLEMISPAHPSRDGAPCNLLRGQRLRCVRESQVCQRPNAGRWSIPCRLHRHQLSCGRRKVSLCLTEVAVTPASAATVAGLRRRAFDFFQAKRSPTTESNGPDLAQHLESDFRNSSRSRLTCGCGPPPRKAPFATAPTFAARCKLPRGVVRCKRIPETRQ